MHEHRKEFPVLMMCQILDVSRSGYYRWIDRPICPRAKRRAQLIEKIKEVQEQSRGTYGSPRVTVELNEADVAVSENTVAKYMRESGICVRPRRRFVPQTTESDHDCPIAPNLLDQNFSAASADQKWACDLTYIWTNEGWLYLSVVIDLFSRRIIGWSMSDHLRGEGVAQALSMALSRRRPGEGLLHHSDRGLQYACELYRAVLEKHRITRSMSRSGNCYDNAVVESFFGTLKSELVHRMRYRTREQAKGSVFEWIECWYNRRRRHSSLGYLSPEAFEARVN
ncbi:MAG TPA: IS3 family transposase [Tepidisphaeraceae bacterium]|nr:IS3 family transposase [Tepidisphaeraceae bacterium]